MEISVLGISHRTAAVELREAFSLPGELPARLLEAVHAECFVDEALVLDTCNRTEIYFVWRQPRDFATYLLSHAGRLKGHPLPEAGAALYRLDGAAAVEHLFAVAAGLDSQVVGEGQILAQLRAAYRLALQQRTARFLLNRLLHQAFHVGKRVRTQTGLGQGAGSIPQAAVELAAQVHPDLKDTTVMLIGAGETAELAAHALLRQGARRLIVANRTVAAAERLAEDLAAGRVGKGRRSATADEAVAGTYAPDSAAGDSDLAAAATDAAAGDTLAVDASACPAYARRHGMSARVKNPAALVMRGIGLDAIAEAIGEVDIIISSTGSTQPVLSFDKFSPVLSRRARPVVIIDIAVPRDVDERLGRLPGVRLLNIDDLDAVVTRTLEGRRKEISHARQIVQEEMQRFEAWRQARQVIPTVEHLRRHLENLAAAEVERYGRRFDPAAREELSRFARSLMAKVLHPPTTFLTELTQQPDGLEPPAAADLVRRLFALDGAVPPPPAMRDNVAQPPSAVQANVAQPPSAVQVNVAQPPSAVQVNVAQPPSAVQVNVAQPPSAVQVSDGTANGEASS